MNNKCSISNPTRNGRAVGAREGERERHTEKVVAVEARKCEGSLGLWTGKRDPLERLEAGFPLFLAS